MEPRCVMTAVFVDHSIVAPLMVIPGTQREGYIDSVEPDADASGAAVYNLDHTAVRHLGLKTESNPFRSSPVPFASSTATSSHGSPYSNESPSRRAIMYLNYNAVSNACTGTERAWYHNNRDFTPLEPIDDDSLAALCNATAD